MLNAATPVAIAMDIERSRWYGPAWCLSRAVTAYRKVSHMDEREIAELQKAVEKLLRAAGAGRTTLNPDEFQATVGEYRKWASQATGDKLAVGLAMHFLANEAASGVRNVAEPPADWRIHSREVMQTFKRDQAQMLPVFGLSRPIHRSEIAPLIQAMQKREEVRGSPPTWLNYPEVTHVGGAAGVQERIQLASVWPGYTDDEVFEALLHENERTSAVNMPPPQPLYRLALTADDVADMTGISQSEAVAFLLADEDVMLPWIRARRRYRQWTGAIEITLTIGTTEVRPEEVRAAYERVRSDLLGGPEEPERRPLVPLEQMVKTGLVESDPPTYTRRPVPDKTAAMLAFVDKYKADRPWQRMTAADWDECNEAFGAEYAGTYEKYKTGETLRTAYSHRKRAARGRH